MPSWEPTAQVGVKVTAERRADRFKSGEAVVPAMPNEHIPHYYASSGPGDELGETDPDADRRGTGGSKTGEEWLEDATALPAQTQFTRQRSGFNVPGSSDDPRRDSLNDAIRVVVRHQGWQGRGSGGNFRSPA